MSNILNFSKWSKLYEADMATELESGGSPDYSKYKGKPDATRAALKSIIANAKKDPKHLEEAVTNFWKLSTAVGGIIKTLAELDLSQSDRALIAAEVKILLGTKYPATVAYFKEWGASTTWEAFTNLFKDEPGRAEGLTDDFRNDFNMPKLSSRQ